MSDSTDPYPNSDDDGARTVANFPTAYQGSAHANQYALPGAVCYPSAVSDPARANGRAADAHYYSQPGAIGDAPAIADFATANRRAADAHGHTTASHSLSYGHAD